ncbi:MAG: hypothetical protein JAZ15_07815, partial [Candidatus Thiodiazotropha endolucinida]|nr:hypothetical protein [Candidatus Thiodiazotropha taylori]MCW4312913.1 hypothetical protein [Candidatus Thiodiazotropha taylori]
VGTMDRCIELVIWVGCAHVVRLPLSLALSHEGRGNASSKRLGMQTVSATAQLTVTDALN